MTPKKKRFLKLLLMAATFAIGVTLVLQAFRENLIFFYTPSEFFDKNPLVLEKIRLGGLVQEKSVRREGETTMFHLTDLTKNMRVIYKGLLPDLFREGQGVVVEGRWIPYENLFRATVVLAKHDENYIPKGVAEKLKNQGYWKGK